MTQGTGKRTACSSWMLCLILVGSCNKASFGTPCRSLCVSWRGVRWPLSPSTVLLIPATWQILAYPSLVTHSLFSPFRFLRNFMLISSSQSSSTKFLSLSTQIYFFIYNCTYVCAMDSPEVASPLTHLVCLHWPSVHAHMRLALPRDNGTCVFTRV